MFTHGVSLSFAAGSRSRITLAFDLLGASAVPVLSLVDFIPLFAEDDVFFRFF